MNDLPSTQEHPMDDTLIAHIADAVVERLSRSAYTPEPRRFTREQAAKLLNVSERHLAELKRKIEEHNARCEQRCSSDNDCYEPGRATICRHCPKHVCEG